MTLEESPPHSGPQAGTFEDYDISDYGLCADGAGPADLGEEGRQLRGNKERTGSWAVIQREPQERGRRLHQLVLRNCLRFAPMSQPVNLSPATT